ncbi:3-hexulose-6-phosphate synthase [Kineothrix sedimenti]|uniref:3-hexulose-6-phosphate synthase n=1 Tax=Kineothrix sedimenti TaxID=3123317 RepID=A0ABZ3F1Q8_9FIRM
MKLQLALDIFNLDEALGLAEKLKEYVDIIEIGTPFVLEYGLEAVRQFRAKFPDKRILADTKIMDAGELESAAAFKAGADYVTVLAVTDIATINACVETANKYGKEIVADMICVEHIPEKIEQLEAIGVHGIAVHTGVDQQKRGRTPMDDLKVMKTYSKSAEISVAGGISLETVPAYAALNPDVLIVGGGITNATDPVQEAKLIYEKISL